MSLTKSTGKPIDIRPATGKLGILTPGMGAVATTFMAGVEAIRKGISKPIGSMTQMGTIRLGKRTDARTPLINEFVPLSKLEDIVFGGWDLFPDDAYQAASKAGVLSKEHLGQLKDFLSTIKPMKAVWEQAYVKKLTATHFKTGKNKADLAAQVMDDIKEFKKKNNCDRLVMVWCGSTEVFRNLAPCHATLASFEKALTESDPEISPSQIYAYAALKLGVPYANGAPNLTVDTPALMELAKQNNVPIGGKDFKTGQTLMKTILAPGFKARLLGVEGWYSTNILGNRDGEVLDDPESFKSKEVSKLGSLEHILQPHLYPDLYGDMCHVDADQDRLPLQGLDPGGADRPRPRAVHGPRAALRDGRHPGVAVVLLEEPAVGAGPLPRARSVHPAHEAEEHTAAPPWGRPHHPPRRRVLRLSFHRTALQLA
jgi:myo-inositol-1-phosphate synthase